MNLPGYNDMVECPYNPAHQLLRSRIQTHLIKCRKSYPNVAKSQCPFNVTHLVNGPELKMHVANCPDRAAFERYKYTSTMAAPAAQLAAPSAAAASSAFPMRPIVKQEPTANGDQPGNYSSILDAEENWDDCDTPTYDPQQYVQNASVLRTLNLAQPAQRAAFRENEIVRLNRLQNRN